MLKRKTVFALGLIATTSFAGIIALPALASGEGAGVTAARGSMGWRAVRVAKGAMA